MDTQCLLADSTDTDSIDDDENNCSICLEDIECGTTITFKCNHKFHNKCISDLIMHNLCEDGAQEIICPLCREVIMHKQHKITPQTTPPVNDQMSDSDSEVSERRLQIKDLKCCCGFLCCLVILVGMCWF
tara:strand:- start:92 stop:481 length:390 start_codon:yes stop_codon:yes gene_type:complete